MFYITLFGIVAVIGIAVYALIQIAGQCSREEGGN